MNKIYYITLIYFCLFVPCHAESADQDNTVQQSEYLSPDEITRDDYEKMAQHSAQYHDCLQEKSRAEINNYNDPRHVVDSAMKLCAYELENLNVWMTERKFSLPFRRGYIRRTSTRTVGKLMPAVMMAIASRQSLAEDVTNPAVSDSNEVRE